MRDKRDIKPVLLKFGVALALSLAGFLYSRLRTRRFKPSTTQPSARPSDHDESEVNLGRGRAQHKDDCHAIKPPSSSGSSLSGRHIQDTEEICKKMAVVDYFPVGLSPSCKTVENDELLLPEFNDILKDVDFGGSIVGNALKKDVELPKPKGEPPKAYVNPEKDEPEQEIRHLKHMIRMLQERERSLEVQLLEYCGLREQETAMMELQNRLKISNVEAKMFSLKIETLQSENRRLGVQVADHAKLVTELEAARAKVKLLKKKLRYEAEQNKEQLKTLQQKVAKLQEQESKAAASDRDIQIQLQKLKDLESAAEELRKSNLGLEIDNSELAQRLDSTQILAHAVLESPEVDALRKESERLKQENENLEKEIELLKSSRCSDVEELVYLRWINACLRYELRNYQPVEGKTLARDLSKSLSPMSEKKAKQLVLEYANSEGAGERGMSIVDFDSDHWSSSQNSFHTDSADGDDLSCVDNSSATRTNTSTKVKFINKLKKLVRGKQGQHKRALSGGKSGCEKDINSPHCSSSISTGNDAMETPSLISTTSLDLQRFTSSKDADRNTTDGTDSASSKIFRIIRPNSEDFRYGLDPFPGSLGLEKTELEKYAEALKDSDSGDTVKHRLRRNAIRSSF
ncbi:hypothetical protein L6164_004327 [Bauhinia variegata]|uniref:Uncharacterized protein n=1 Tax=Bauhinia variegata TaxID=167791 RepID=A0ACB9Q440_BAUVA|nr:hypothetical protein L6164_004327 [Bauhinia variegata]